MLVHFKDCSLTYEEIISVLKENLPSAYLLTVPEREDCLKAVEVMERVFSRFPPK